MTDIATLATTIYEAEGQALRGLPYDAQMRHIGQLCDQSVVEGLIDEAQEYVDLAVCLRAKVRKDATPADGSRGRGMYR